MEEQQEKTLIFVVSYQASEHLEKMLSRVPVSLFESDLVHFLVIDDASRDSSAELVARWASERGIRNVTVLRNPVNQGYGGNQKLGYRWALEHGFDFTILLHGDGQYAPELLPEFLATRQRTGADVVLGSRMHRMKSALEGGMPLYKAIGNRILTQFQNWATGKDLSEYHTGYRAYASDLLRKIPFEVNTNDFHFDTEILLQAMYVEAAIEEIPIPTHYGDEVCHVPGMRYAADVVSATMQYKFHRWGMFCSLKFRNLEPLNYRDKSDFAYTSHSMALDVVARESPETLLDIGSGPGFVAKKCEQMGVRVTGLDQNPPLEGTMTRFVKLDLDRPLPVDPFDFDMVLMLDVIEHLVEPEAFLLDLRNRSQSLSPENPPLLVLSTPNVAFATVRLNLLLGRFSYAERGILDITHKRLFTRRSLQRSLVDCGYEVEKMIPVPVPWQAVFPGRMGRALGLLSSLLARLWGSLFAFQFLVLCRPKPGVRQLLAVTERHLVSELAPEELASANAESSDSRVPLASA